jgi:hypothetical protein
MASLSECVSMVGDRSHLKRPLPPPVPVSTRPDGLTDASAATAVSPPASSSPSPTPGETGAKSRRKKKKKKAAQLPHEPTSESKSSDVVNEIRELGKKHGCPSSTDLEKDPCNVLVYLVEKGVLDGARLPDYWSRLDEACHVCNANLPSRYPDDQDDYFPSRFNSQYRGKDYY